MDEIVGEREWVSKTERERDRERKEKRKRERESENGGLREMGKNIP